MNFGKILEILNISNKYAAFENIIFLHVGGLYYMCFVIKSFVPLFYEYNSYEYQIIQIYAISITIIMHGIGIHDTY